MITLSCLADKIDPKDASPEFKLKDLIAQSEDTGHNQNSGEPMKRKNKVKKVKKIEKDFSGESDNNQNGLGQDMSRFD